MLDRVPRLEAFQPAPALQHAAEHRMKKQELEAILGDGENTPDLGPIEGTFMPSRRNENCRTSLSEFAR
jgi:hypothetical protein